MSKEFKLNKDFKRNDTSFEDSNSSIYSRISWKNIERRPKKGIKIETSIKKEQNKFIPFDNSLEPIVN